MKKKYEALAISFLFVNLVYSHGMTGIFVPGLEYRLTVRSCSSTQFGISIVDGSISLRIIFPRSVQPVPAPRRKISRHKNSRIITRCFFCCLVRSRRIAVCLPDVRLFLPPDLRPGSSSSPRRRRSSLPFSIFITPHEHRSLRTCSLR